MNNIIDSAKRIADAALKGIKTRAEQRRNEQEARKEGVPVEVIEYKNYVQAHMGQAVETSMRFNEALARIGWKIDGKIETNTKGEQKVSIGLYAMSYDEHQDFTKFHEGQAKKREEKIKNLQAPANEPAPSQGSEPERTEAKTDTDIINPDKTDEKST